MTQERTIHRFRRSGPGSVDELRELEEVRAKAQKEFPPRNPPRLQPATTEIGARIRQARETEGLTWYSVAHQAGVDGASVVRDIEAVAKVVRLRLELVEV